MSSFEEVTDTVTPFTLEKALTSLAYLMGLTTRSEVTVWGVGHPEHTRSILDELAEKPDLQKVLDEQVNTPYQQAGRRARVFLPEDFFSVCLNNRPKDQEWLASMHAREFVLTRMPRHYSLRRLDGEEPFDWTIVCNLSGYVVRHLAVGMNVTTVQKKVLLDNDAEALIHDLRSDALHLGVPETYQSMVGPFLE